jgi:hypothetical protein
MKRRTWSFVQENEFYVDYDHRVPDVESFGVRLTLTFNKETRTAYMLVLLDNDFGEDIAEGEMHGIPWAVACAMTGYVEGAR